MLVKGFLFFLFIGITVAQAQQAQIVKVGAAGVGHLVSVADDQSQKQPNDGSVEFRCDLKLYVNNAMSKQPNSGDVAEGSGFNHTWYFVSLKKGETKSLGILGIGSGKIEMRNDGYVALSGTSIIGRDKFVETHSRFDRVMTYFDEVSLPLIQQYGDDTDINILTCKLTHPPVLGKI